MTDAAIQPAAFDLDAVRRDFPILARQSNGQPLAYLDNAATTQKPQAVLDAIHDYYAQHNANVHRGVHQLSMEATEAYEGARRKVQRFLNAPDAKQIVFTRGTTEAINLVAHSYARPRLSAGDEIVLTHMEHHSNIVPWQLVAEQTGATLRVAPIDDHGELIFDEFEKLLSERTKLVAAVHVSNALGTVNPVQRIMESAHRVGAAVLLDGAQATAHLPVDVAALDCDFYAFSGHKMLGPTGIGALYAKAEHLDAMPPYQGGGEMIRSVSFEGTTYAEPPAKFEAGTPNIAGAVGLGAAIDYLENVGLDHINSYEHDLLAYGTEALQAVPGLRLVGTAREKAGVLSFLLDDIHPHDIGTILDTAGIAIRSGHHCAQPVMDRFGVAATARASLALYNTREEIDRLAAALQKVKQVFGGG
ncbi:MAG: SufS family cysteine desulfurase [Phycisphaeraceae bacterium]